MRETSKDRTMLTDLERELRERLQIDLARVASGEDSLYFYNPDYNPFGLPESKLSTRGAEAYGLACRVRDLRDKLGEPSACEAWLLLGAISDHADQGNQQRLGAKRLAANLMADLDRKSMSNRKE